MAHEIRPSDGFIYFSADPARAGKPFVCEDRRDRFVTPQFAELSVEQYCGGDVLQLIAHTASRYYRSSTSVVVRPPNTILTRIIIDAYLDRTVRHT